MAEQRLVQTGTVGGVAVYADVVHLGGAHKIIIGDLDYVAVSPPGYPLRPGYCGADTAQAGSVTFTAGSTVSLLHCEADALVTAGFASYA